MGRLSAVGGSVTVVGGDVQQLATGVPLAALDGNYSQPIICGHRGDYARRPESALGSYLANLEEWPEPYMAMEADVGLTSDNVPVIMHDATVDRTTDGTGNLNAKTAAQVAALTVRDLGVFGLVDNPPLTVPTLAQLLELARERVTLIEAKSTTVAAYMLTEIQAAGVEHMVLPNAFAISALQPFINAGMPVLLHSPDQVGLTPQQIKDAGVTHINWRTDQVPANVDPYLAVGLKVWAGGTGRYSWSQMVGKRCGGITDDAMWTLGQSPVLTEDAFDQARFLPGHLPYTAGAVGSLIDRGDGVKCWAPGFATTDGLGTQGNGWVNMGHLSPHPNSRTAPWDYVTGFGALPAAQNGAWGWEFDVTYLEAGSTPTRRWGVAFCPNDRPFHDTVTGATLGYGTYLHGDSAGTAYWGMKGQGATRTSAASGADGLGAWTVGQTRRYRLRRKSPTQLGITVVTGGGTEVNVTVSSANPDLYQGGYLWLGNPGVSGSTGRWGFSNIVQV